MRSSWVYILQCTDGSYYTGCTTNITKRISEDEQGIIPGFTSRRLPVTLVYSQEFPDIRYAINAERQIKGWTRKKKEALIHGDFDLLHELAQCRNETNYKKLLSKKAASSRA
jgi:predicted GIY-YIG superfamily endonuclease